MLTRKQKELLLFIHRSIAKEGITPSFDEMKHALGLRSKSGIHRLITGLEERGFIKRLPHRARALEIVRLPDDFTEKQNLEPTSLSSVPLPLYGRIAAGTPIEALCDPSAAIDVPTSMLTNNKENLVGEHYALEVSGDSMIDAGIIDGDYVLIRRTNKAENGAIVVALVDDHEATLKYLQRRPENEIALIPANKNYQPRILSAERVKVQGQLMGLVRHY